MPQLVPSDMVESILMPAVLQVRHPAAVMHVAVVVVPESVPVVEEMVISGQIPARMSVGQSIRKYPVALAGEQAAVAFAMEVGDYEAINRFPFSVITVFYPHEKIPRPEQKKLDAG